MKRLKISSLMDEYTDNEFFPTGGSAVSPERVKARVLAQAMAAAPTRRKQKMPRKKKILLAAALAAALVVLVGAGYPYFQRQLVNGSLSFGQDEGGRFVSFEAHGSIMEVEDGRLYYTPEDGQRVDVTDLVSEETPYIYDGSDPDNGLTYYIIMGGTPECYGWFTWVRTPNPFDSRGDAPAVNEDGSYTAYHFRISSGSSHMGIGSPGGFRIVEWNYDMDHPWLLAGAEQLGITFVPTEEFEAMVEAGTR